jgi:hypothetical protein
MLATIHPSYLLRFRDDRDKAAKYRLFVAISGGQGRALIAVSRL